MPGGLVALLDDVAVIARAAAASMDDVAAAAGKASSKAAGVVIDDAAVTPKYVTGVSPDRELPIIAKITRGSLINKLLILLPAALLLSAFLPWAITPILMLGGAYLSYEGAEKVMEWITGVEHGETLADPIEDMAAFEKQRVAGAIRTDLILSGEIMAITLSSVADESLMLRAGVLGVVGIGITLAIYGAVALIVKMDDVGLHLAGKQSQTAQTIGRGLVAGMPHLLTILSIVGTLAMLWVGGGIILHGMEELGVHGLPDLVHKAELAVEHGTGAMGGLLGWLSYATLSALFGLVLGGVIAVVLHKILGVGKTDH
ncbi:DUF808 domain-containing protein [Qipengyuania marisflavi]|uniref:DUF808 domain-containing protein n=1 Tax=Qipengyuania marisflavi TaxID=2486356 RepID=A0A5S3P9T7_9SPHN|nr:DUF808 domain-containing protein [Qipengyuania marisflavi]TMM50103.1 DUF808 domain-containing protein [Qipengyuania marisflavi]